MAIETEGSPIITSDVKNKIGSISIRHNKEEKCDVTLPWWQRRRRQGERKKQLVYISKTTTLHVHHAFLNISEPSLHVLRQEWSWWTNFLFFLLRYGRSGLNPRQFRHHLTNLISLICDNNLWNFNFYFIKTQRNSRAFLLVLVKMQQSHFN